MRPCLLFVLLATPLTAGEVEDLVQDLGSPDWPSRQAASERLVEYGAVARPELLRAAGSIDPEVRWRGRDALAEVERRLRILRASVALWRPWERTGRIAGASGWELRIANAWDLPAGTPLLVSRDGEYIGRATVVRSSAGRGVARVDLAWTVGLVRAGDEFAAIPGLDQAIRARDWLRREGRVIAVHTGVGLAMVDAGAGAGMEKGMGLEVAREGVFLYALIVEEIFEDMASARIDARPYRSEPREGDLVELPPR